jgi:hypothetical protein
MLQTSFITLKQLLVKATWIKQILKNNEKEEHCKYSMSNKKCSFLKQSDDKQDKKLKYQSNQVKKSNSSSSDEQFNVKNHIAFMKINEFNHYSENSLCLKWDKDKHYHSQCHFSQNLKLL